MVIRCIVPASVRLPAVALLPDVTVASHKLAFKGEGAAGYGKAENPQFFLSLSRPSRVLLTMKVNGPSCAS